MRPREPSWVWWEVGIPSYMPSHHTRVGVPGSVHAPRPHHAGPVLVDGLLGCAPFDGALQVVGKVSRGVPEGVF